MVQFKIYGLACFWNITIENGDFLVGGEDSGKG